MKLSGEKFRAKNFWGEIWGKNLEGEKLGVPFEQLMDGYEIIGRVLTSERLCDKIDGEKDGY